MFESCRLLHIPVLITISFPFLGTKASSRSSKSQRQLKISYVDSGEEHKSVDSKQRRSTRSSRRDRVHPEGRRPSRAMDDDGKQRSKRLTVQAGYHDEDRQSTHSRTPKGVRGSRDLRSPGVKNTPTAQTARLSSSHGMPDFITQTDANGNATTPRSADAINGARKSHPSGRRPKLHVDKRGRLTDDDSDDDSDKGGRYSSDDPCDALFESLRMMCCCFMEEGKPTRSLTGTGQITQDSDDRPKLLGDLHPDDHGKKCLVLDLDETLVHSSFRAVPNADFVIPVQVCVLILMADATVFIALHFSHYCFAYRLKMLYISYMLLNAPALMNSWLKWRNTMRLSFTLPA